MPDVSLSPGLAYDFVMHTGPDKGRLTREILCHRKLVTVKMQNDNLTMTLGDAKSAPNFT